jgi:hypothetical protein
VNWNIHPNPNPTRNAITISFDDYADYEVIIMDVNGKELYKESTDKQEMKINLDELELANGIYSVLLKSGIHTQIKKIVKM